MQGSAKESWTSRPTLIEALHFLYEGTEQTLVLRSRELGLPASEDHANWNTPDLADVSSDAQSELKAALAEEAGYLLAMFEERLVYLRRYMCSHCTMIRADTLFMQALPSIARSTCVRASLSFNSPKDHFSTKSVLFAFLHLLILTNILHEQPLSVERTQLSRWQNSIMTSQRWSRFVKILRLVQLPAQITTSKNTKHLSPLLFTTGSFRRVRITRSQMCKHEN